MVNLEFLSFRRNRTNLKKHLSEKEQQFERLWKGLTPRGLSLQKRREFRSKMKSACQQLGYDFDKHNARLYFSGRLNEDDEEQSRKDKFKSYKPPRRFLRHI